MYSSPTENVTVKQKYKGNRIDSSKGVHSERRDILHKNLIRSIRRYLWTQFQSEHDVSKFGSRKHSDIYEQWAKSFYQRFLKSKTIVGEELSEEQDQKACFIFSIVMSTNFYFSKMNSQQIKLASLFKTILKSYSVRNYHKFILLPEVKTIMRMLYESKIIGQIIKEYSCLSKSSETYTQAFLDLLSFEG